MAAAIKCPKCGFEQDDGTECHRCGIIFSRMHAPAEGSLTATTPDPEKGSKRPAVGSFRKYYRVFRWVSLIVVVIVAALILYDSPPPGVQTSPYAIKQAEVKVREFQSSIQQGREDELELDQSELNGWLQTNLAIQDPEGPASSTLQQQETEPESIETILEQYEIEEEELEKAKSSIRDLQVQLLADTVRLYALFETHGIDLSLEIEGRLWVQQGYLRLDPVRGSLGSLPLPMGTLQSAVDKLFDSPQNREKFRLPLNIRDIRIDGGQLVVSSGEGLQSFL